MDRQTEQQDSRGRLIPSSSRSCDLALGERNREVFQSAVMF